MLARGRKIYVWAGIVCGLFMAFAWGLAWFLESRFPRDFLLARMNETIPGYLLVDKVRLGIFAGQLDLEGIVLQGEAGKDLVRIKKLGLDLSWTRLMSKEISLSRLVLDSPEFRLSILEDGSSNLLTALIPPRSSPPERSTGPLEIPFNILIDEFELNQGRVQVKMPDNDLNLVGSGLDIRVSEFDLFETSARLKMEMATGDIQYKGQFFVLDPWLVQADLEEGQLSDILVQGGSSGVDMKIRGQIKDIFTTPVLDMSLASGIILEPVVRAAGIKNLDLNGRVRAKISVKGRPDNPGVKIFISSKGGGVNQYSFGRSDFRLMMTDRQATMGVACLGSPVGDFSLDGKVDLETAFPNGFLQGFDLNEVSYEADLALEGVKLSAMAPTLPKGQVSSRIRLEGQGVYPENLRAAIQSESIASFFQSREGGGPMDFNLSMDADFDQSVAKVSSICLTMPGGEFTGQGRMDIASREILGRLELEMDDLGALDRLSRVQGKGRLRATADIDGPFGSWVTLSLLGSNLALNDIFLGDLTLNAGLEPSGQLDIDLLELSRGRSLISVSGRAGVLDSTLSPIPDPDVEINLSGDSVFLEDFFKDLRGSLFLDGQVKGRISNLGGRLNIEGQALGFKDQSIDEFSSKIFLQGSVLEIAQLDIQVAPGSVVKARGTAAPMDQTFDLRVASDDFDLTCLDPVKKTGVSSGRLFLDLSARGPMKDPEVKGNLGVKHLVISGEKQAPGNFGVELRNRRLEIKGDLGFPMEGTFHLDTQAYTAALDMDGVDLSPYFKLWGRPQLTGRVFGRIQARGQGDRLDLVKGSADLSKLDIQFANRPFMGIKDLGILVENGQYRLGPVHIRLLEKGRLWVKGKGSLGGALDFQAQGDIPLDIISPLVKPVESASGRIRMNAAIDGSIASPRVSGEIQFKGLGLSIDSIDQDFKEIEGRINVSPGQVEILGVKGALGQGHFDLGGSIGLKEWAVNTIDLTLNALQLNLDIPDVIDLNLNGHLSLGGDGDGSDLVGEIVLVEGRYYKDVELDLVSSATRRTRKLAPLEERSFPEFFRNIGLNVHLSRRKPLLVDNNLAYLQVSPDLTIQGSLDAPLLAGRAQVDSGIINFQKVEFEVKKGIIDFLNPYKIEPDIEIEGETQIRDWTITLAVSGTPDNLDFQFSSDPSEQHEDILSLIAFGKTTRELRSADGGGGFAPQGILSGMVADILEKKGKEATGFDYFEIKPQDTDDQGNPGVKVTIGTDLSRKISVKYGVDVRNGETVQRVTTDYKLLENLFMRGYQDTGGNFGGELKYRLEFR
ncbi:MAG: translocation/assembly module TamB domain-containing protein [Desulfobacter sp.]|nr:MAG: translocation/assembly module TamB domain-containing protein [Desulfobacter sp.]